MLGVYAKGLELGDSQQESNRSCCPRGGGGLRPGQRYYTPSHTPPAAIDLPFLVLPVRIRKHEQLELNYSADEAQTSFFSILLEF